MALGLCGSCAELKVAPRSALVRPHFLCLLWETLDGRNARVAPKAPKTDLVSLMA